MGRILTWGLWIICATATLSGVQMTLDARAVTEAIAIGQSRVDAERARFHAPYRLPVNEPPIDFVEVETPFRRVVLHAESRARVGDRTFGQRQALEMLSAAPAELAVWVELTFHPQNTYVGIPPFEVLLTDRSGARIPPRGFERLTRYGARVDGEPSRLAVPGGLAWPGGSQPMLGGTIIARFDGRPLNANGAYDVLIVEGKAELARVRVDFGRLR